MSNVKSDEEVSDCRPQSPDTYPPRTIAFLLYSSLAMSLVVLGSLTNQLIISPLQAQVLGAAPPAVSASVVPTSTPLLTASPSATPTDSPSVATLIEQYQPIKKYITTIFGRSSATAYAIAFAESGKWDKDTGRPYFLSSAVRSSSVEVSVGVFQINLKNITSKVHYDQIPGHDSDPDRELAKKIKWLQNPYNNVLYAYWVYTTSGYHPWSTYTDGTYVAYLK